MPEVVEPGVRLVERYRLDERLDGADQPGGATRATAPDDATTYWRAHDELLDRPVGVCLLRTGDVHADRVLRSARKAAVLTDSRFLRVLDASEVDGVVYVVSEWVTATHLVDLLADGPLPAGEARALTIEIAGALAAAHEAGLAHLCLGPEHVLRTSHGQVKLAGLGVDAAARGIEAPDPADAAARDTAAAAGILYACLTARWPGETASALASAPYDGADLCSPRQVRAGVPDDLDGVACRALGIPGRHHGGGALRTPGELVTALGSTQGTARLPVADPSPTTARESAGGAGYSAPYDDQGPARRRPGAATLGWVLAALVLVAGLVLAGSQVMTILDGDPDDASAGEKQKAADDQPPAEVAPIKIVDATTLDPSPDGNGEENDERAALAIDDDATGTAWNTESYIEQFGPTGLKDGVGLVLDLGSPHDVSKVVIRVNNGATDLEIRVADRKGTSLDDYTPVKEQANVYPRTIVRLGEPVSARYVLVWLTSLPPVEGRFRGEIANVVVSG